MKAPFLRRISILVLTTFLVTNHLAIPAFASTAASAITSTVSKSLPKDLSKLALPQEIGKVVEVYGGERPQTVILIQDAHAVPDAQRSIWKLIRHFQKEYGVNLTALEGASSELDPQFFRSFPDKEILKKVFEEYLERGELTGPAAASVFSPEEGPEIYRGIEDWPLYEESLGLYLKALEKEGEILAKTALLKTKLQEQKESVYSKELLELDRGLQNFRANHTNLLPLLKKLARLKLPEKGTELALVLEEARREGKDQAPIEIEVKKIALKVKSFLNSKSTGSVSFNQKFQEFQTSEISPEAFALYLEEWASEHKLPLEISEELSHLAANQKRMRKLEGSRFMRDFESYLQSVKDLLLRSEAEKKLDRESRQLELLERLVRLELSREDWEEIQTEDPAFEKSLSPSVFGLLSFHFAFYESAEKRDGVFYENLSRLNASPLSHNAVILVAGGFHAEGLIRRLKENKVSYLLVVPKIRSLPKNSRYRELMRGEVSWKDYYKVENGRVNLYDAFIRGTRDRLLNVGARLPRPMQMGEETPPLQPDPRLILKSWRDRIIRDLARKEKITQVQNYTSFIDEALLKEGKPAFMPEWRIKVERLIKGLRRLEARGKFTEQNVLRLIQPAALLYMAGGNTDLAVGSTASVSSLPGLHIPDPLTLSRSEARSDTPSFGQTPSNNSEIPRGKLAPKQDESMEKPQISLMDRFDQIMEIAEGVGTIILAIAMPLLLAGMIYLFADLQGKAIQQFHENVQKENERIRQIEQKRQGLEAEEKKIKADIESPSRSEVRNLNRREWLQLGAVGVIGAVAGSVATVSFLGHGQRVKEIEKIRKKGPPRVLEGDLATLDLHQALGIPRDIKIKSRISKENGPDKKPLLLIEAEFYKTEENSYSINLEIDPRDASEIISGEAMWEWEKTGAILTDLSRIFKEYPLYSLQFMGLVPSTGEVVVELIDFKQNQGNANKNAPLPLLIFAGVPGSIRKYKALKPAPLDLENEGLLLYEFEGKNVLSKGKGLGGILRWNRNEIKHFNRNFIHIPKKPVSVQGSFAFDPAARHFARRSEARSARSELREIAATIVKEYRGINVSSDFNWRNAAGRIVHFGLKAFMPEVYAAVGEAESAQDIEQGTQAMNHFDAIQAIDRPILIEHRVSEDDFRRMGKDSKTIIAELLQAAYDASATNKFVLAQITVPEKAKNQLRLANHNAKDAVRLEIRGNTLTLYNQGFADYAKFLNAPPTITITDLANVKGPVLFSDRYGNRAEIRYDGPEGTQTAARIFTAALVWAAEALSQKTFDGLVRSENKADGFRVRSHEALHNLAFVVEMMAAYRAELRLQQAA